MQYRRSTNDDFNNFVDFSHITELGIANLCSAETSSINKVKWSRPGHL